MFGVSEEFKAAISMPHRVVAWVEILGDDGSTILLDEATDATVSYDAEADIGASASFNLPDPDGIFMARNSVDDLLSPFGSEVRMWRGVEYPDGTIEPVPLGVFRVMTNQPTEVAGGRTLAISCADRSIIPARKLPRTLGFARGTPVTEAITTLVRALHPGADIALLSVPDTTPALLLDVGESAWAKARELAQTVGCVLRVNRLGQYVMEPVPLADSPIVWNFVEGEQTIITEPLSRSSGSSIPIPNGWLVKSSSTGAENASRILAEAWDEDPSSVTYRYGRYGQNCEIYESEKIQSIPSAHYTAQALLQRSLARTDEVPITTIVNPALDADDAVALVRTGLEIAGVFSVAAMTVPLSVTEASAIDLRQLYGGNFSADLTGLLDDVSSGVGGMTL